AVAFQAVLQKGSAVLVDTDGFLRVRCASGSPLLPPESLDAPTYSDTRWEGFDPSNLVAPPAPSTGQPTGTVHPTSTVPPTEQTPPPAL
ncbi:MAG: LCCL domain protein, partial [Actinobacteria bacterium]|nr:LCCL domain protein [Actinomycetota bacterium]